MIVNKEINKYIIDLIVKLFIGYSYKFRIFWKFISFNFEIILVSKKLYLKI